MYGIFTYIYTLNYPNVGIYTIHWVSGLWFGAQTALPMSMVANDSLATTTAEPLNTYTTHHNSSQLYVILDIRITKTWRPENSGEFYDDISFFVWVYFFVYAAVRSPCKFPRFAVVSEYWGVKAK